MPANCLVVIIQKEGENQPKPAVEAKPKTQIISHGYREDAAIACAYS
jgi:hypothetical protein